MWISALLAASGLAAVAASSTQCVTRDICFGLAVPASTGFAGRGNVYMTITAAHSVQWVALGQGTRMAAANMFVVYPSANGSSVTLSNRLGTDHTQPAQRAGSRAHLSSAGLSASGQLSAGILCSDCDAWSGGGMDFSVASSSWIYAYKTGPALKSDDANARLQQHDGYGHLTFSFTDAAISADEQGNFTFVDGPAAPELPRSLLLMHALGAVAVVLVVFPVGLLTLASRRRPFGHSLHVAIQLLGVAVFVAAAGVGIYIARVKQQLHTPHALLGLGIFVLVLAQPVLGFLNIFFAARPHSRRMVSLAHKIVALLIIVGGLVTGLLGFVLTAHTTGIIILAILASVMAVCASTIELCAMRSRKQATRLPLPLSPTLDPLEYAQDKGRGWQ